MSIEIKVPDIGGDEVEVTEILVSVGDKVEVDQSLLSVEGDKAAMEVPAAQAGTVKEIKVSEGDTVTTGSLIMIFEGEETGSQSEPEAPAKAEAAAPAEASGSDTQEVTVPDIGDDEVEVTEVMVAVGDSVEEEQSILNVEGDKAAMEVPAPFAGTVKEIKVATGDKVKTGSLIFVFEVAGSTPSDAPAKQDEAKAESKPAAQAESKPTAAPEKVSAESFEDNSAYAHASPVVRRLAREFGINLANVKGTGRKNRVVKEDVQNYVKQLVKQVESGQVPAAKGNAGGGELGLIAWPKVDFAKFGEIEEKKLSRIQKLSGKNLHRNWVQIPHVTQFDEADITSLEQFRKEQNALNEKKKLGVKITPLVFVMKAAAKALAEFPTFNSSLSEDGESLILKKYINIGVAVDTPNGLVVPVFKDVDKKDVELDTKGRPTTVMNNFYKGLRIDDRIRGQVSDKIDSLKGVVGEKRMHILYSHLYYKSVMADQSDTEVTVYLANILNMINIFKMLNVKFILYSHCDKEYKHNKIFLETYKQVLETPEYWLTGDINFFFRDWAWKKATELLPDNPKVAFKNMFADIIHFKLEVYDTFVNELIGPAVIKKVC